MSCPGKSSKIDVPSFRCAHSDSLPFGCLLRFVFPPFNLLLAGTCSHIDPPYLPLPSRSCVVDVVGAWRHRLLCMGRTDKRDVGGVAGHAAGNILWGRQSAISPQLIFVGGSGASKWPRNLSNNTVAGVASRPHVST